MTLMVPLGIGNHIDPQLTRAAAECLNLPLQYYLDYPYVAKNNLEILQRAPENHHLHRHQISGQALNKWQESIAAHQSQARAFWSDQEAMRTAISNYYDQIVKGIWIYEAD